MESLVPDIYKDEYLLWKVSCDEVKAVVHRAKQAVDEKRGIVSLELHKKNVEVASVSYNNYWTHFCQNMVEAQVPIETFLKEHVDVKTTLSLGEEAVAEAMDNFQSSVSNVPRAPGLHFKLPHIKIPEFHGETEQWEQFWGLFESLVDQRADLPTNAKFTYLKNALKGPSAKIIAGFTITEANYDEAKKLLLAQYKDDKKCQRKLTRQLLELKSPKHDFPDLQNFRITYNQLLRAIKAYEDTTNSEWIILENLLLKISKETELFIFHHLKTQYFTLDEFDKALKALVNLLENSGRDKKSAEDKKSGDHASKVKREEQPSKSKVMWQTTARSPPSCEFCAESHYANCCPTYTTLEDRKACLRTNQRCLKCGKAGHWANNCSTKLSCFQCKGTHWVGLCQQAIKGKSNSKGNLAGGSKSDNKSQSPKRPVKGQGGTTGKGGLSTNQKDEETRNSTKGSEKTGEKTTTNRVVVQSACGKGEKSVALPTAIMIVKEQGVNKEPVKVRTFFDLGSQKSFIHPDTVKRLGITPTRHTVIGLAVFGQEPTSVRCPVVGLKMALGRRVARVEFLVTSKVRTTLDCPGLKATVANLRKEGVRLADSKASDVMDDVQAVIGADSLGKFISGMTHIGGVNLLCSPGGHIIYGALPCGTPTKGGRRTSQSVVVCQVTVGEHEVSPESISSSREPRVELLWELDAIGIKEEQHSPGERNAMQLFANNIKYENNRYWVGLPWKVSPDTLPTNYRMAVGQLSSLIKTLEKNPVKLAHYKQVIQDYLEQGFIEEVRDPQICGHYLPHHAVLKESATTPLRIVFNASARIGPNSISLNQALETGPSLTEKLVDSLVSFRIGRYGILADISKAFLRVGLQLKDRDYVRFLWTNNNGSGKPTTYRFKSVLFGSTASPFLLQATLNKHFEDSMSPIKEVLKRGFYVDNFQATADDVSELQTLYREATDCLAKASMPLQEWNSNSEEFNRCIGDDERKECPSVLGIHWNTLDDTLSVKSVCFGEVKSLTKRKALSIFSKVFDPIGLLNPVMVRGKLFISKLWKLKIGWDEDLGEELVEEFKNLTKDFGALDSIKFPRKVCLKEDTCTLHVFCDASSRAYGAVAYICDGHRANLLISRSRIAPMKEKTIPQLELTAVLLGSKLASYVQEVLRKSFPIYIWSDSSTCLQWVEGNNSNKVYVQNRVGEILTLREKLKFEMRHVTTKQNPADLLSRGCDMKTLKSSKFWTEGPEWLSKYKDWPKPLFQVTMNEIVTQDVQLEPVEALLDIERYSDLNKLLRVTDYVLKFIKCCKPNKFNHLDSCQYWLRCQQRQQYPLVYEALETQSHENKYLDSRKFIADLGLYLDHSSIIRSKGRLNSSIADYGMKNPILLPPKGHLCRLLIENRHFRTHHAGVQETLSLLREEFWIPHGRQTIKKLLNRCVTCRYTLRKAFKYPGPPDLPRERVTFDRPFQNTGVDYTGAIKLKNNQGEITKYYVCLFSCTATRAVHLELVDSLSAEAFLLCFRRFVARFSLPDKLISDNGTNFVATNRFLASLQEDQNVKEYLQNHRVTWYFISPRAPWQGGVYERMIGVVKGSLHKALHNRQVNEAELRTILTEVESVVNNRPLTYVGEDSGTMDTLTPSHLLFGRKIKIYPTFKVDPEEQETVDNVHILHDYSNKLSQITNKFIRLWSHDYLQCLREKHYSPEPVSFRQPKVGEVVIVATEPDRSKWSLGRIVELVQGTDGAVREVLIFSKGSLSRKTIEKLIPLELDDVQGKDKVLEEEVVPEENVEELVGAEALPQISTRPKRKTAVAADNLIKDLVQKDLL